MTRPDPARPPHDLFDAIATLLEPCQREYFYQRMLYFRQLRPDDELLRIVEAIGFLALIIRDAPHAVAIEREHSNSCSRPTGHPSRPPRRLPGPIRNSSTID